MGSCLTDYYDWRKDILHGRDTKEKDEKFTNSKDNKED